MTDRTPTTEAGRRFVAAYTLPEELGAVLAIEDEARAPLVAALENVGAAHTIKDGEVVWCALLEALEALSREERP